MGIEIRIQNHPPISTWKHSFLPPLPSPPLAPLQGEDIWYTEDIVKQIEEEGDSIAVIYLCGKYHMTVT